jgi:hypothetical protein
LPLNGHTISCARGTWKARSAGRLPNTLILETSFVAADGEVTLIDFLAMRDRAPHLVRLVVGKRGTVPQDPR